MCVSVELGVESIHRCMRLRHGRKRGKTFKETIFMFSSSSDLERRKERKMEV
jgi:hypothetical protein